MSEPHETNGRTHEPNLREVTIELDGLRALIDERDRRYTELRKDDQKAVEAALITAEKATQEFKESQKDYNQAHNGLLQKMDDQHKETLPRIEANSRFEALTTKDEELRRDMLGQREELRREAQTRDERSQRDIQSLRESRSEGTGQARHEITATQRTQWSTGLIVTSVIGSFAVVLSFAAIVTAILLHK